MLYRLRNQLKLQNRSFGHSHTPQNDTYEHLQIDDNPFFSQWKMQDFIIIPAINVFDSISRENIAMDAAIAETTLLACDLNDCLCVV